jgi:hypothetical protein
MTDIQRDDRILGGDKTIWDLSGEPSPPTLTGVVSKCSVHALYHPRQYNCASLRKTISQKLEPEEMVGMRARDVNRG